jgi:hypothetical protein
MAYWLDDVLFRKTFHVYADSLYPDNNCNAELYCSDQFIELESLAPLKILNPNSSVSHMETWDIFCGSDSLPAEIRHVLAVE